ncbi:MAG: RNA 3'-terminal phosphate cyclase [Nitrospirae bacterium]|nr:RNA 3'-terminal phosphate cyclase [Nitrospirota bacterium]
MIEIDGGLGEGGGQILRTALSLSCLFQRPFRIFNIRKGRKKPGLMPQHLTSVRAARLISDAEVRGDNIGATELVFSPGDVKAGDFFFDKATVILKGGTHVPFSPSYDYIAKVFSPFLERVGIKIELGIESYGFYPKGGGKIRVETFPAEDIKPLKISERGKILRIRGISSVGNLPLSIADRQRSAVIGKIRSEIKDIEYPVEIEAVNVPTPGQGTSVNLLAESENSIAGFTALGKRGKSAEAVGEEAAMEFIEYYYTEAALDKYLPDQLVIYLSMSKEESIFTTSCITQHLMTNLWVISLFHNFNYSVDGAIGKPGTVRIGTV